MEEQLEQYRDMSLALCYRLLNEVNRNLHEADRGFHGDIHKSYVDATEMAIAKANKSLKQIKNL